MSSSEVIRGILSHRRIPLLVAALGVLLCISSLWLGLQNDDYILRLVLSDPPLDPEWTRSSTDAFTFINGDEELIRNAVVRGRLPWWTHPRLKLAFLRPVTSFTHWIDFQFWPSQPWLMHLQSLLWFAGAIFAAAKLYRRLLLPTWVAGLAGLLFAIDDAHGMPAVWLANRNASIGVFLRVDGPHRSRSLAPRRMAPWRVDCAACTPPGSHGRRDRSGSRRIPPCLRRLPRSGLVDETTHLNLVPGGVAGAVWWIAYRLLGYGATGSGVYIDPGASPVAFAQAVIERAPMLFSGLWALPSGLGLMLSQSATHVLWLLTVGLMGMIAILLLPILKRDPTARFFALGMVLSLLPACATFPDDRLLYFAGFGGMGLLALFMTAVWRRVDWVPASRMRRLPLSVACWAFVVIHLVFSPLALATTANKIRIFGTIISRAADSLPSDPGVREQTALIVNTPSVFFSIYGPLMQGLEGHAIPNRTLTLGSGIYPTTISRPAPKVLAIRPSGGYLVPAGSPQPGQEGTQPAFHPAYFHQMLDHLYRDATPFRVGDFIDYGGALVEIAEATEDGRPIEVRVHFDVDLEDTVVALAAME